MAEKRKRTNIKINAMMIGGLMFLSLGIIFRVMFKAEMNVTSFVYMTTGIASVLLLFLNLGSASAPERFNHTQDEGEGPGNIMLSLAGLLSSIGLLFAGMLLWVAPLSINGVPQEEYAPVREALHSLFVIDILCIIGIMMCMNAWSKYIVKEGCLVLTDTKVLYPGDKYRIWQWENYMPQVVPKEFSVKINSLTVRSKNEEKPVGVDIITSANIDIGKAKKLGITNIDLPIFARDAETKLSLAIKKQTSSITFADLFRGVLTPEEMIIAGVPVIWDGKVQIFSVKE